MTRRTFLRVLIALHFAATGNAWAFRWLLPRRYKHSMSLQTWRVMEYMRLAVATGSPHVEEIFQRRPLLAYLRDRHGPIEGGTSITCAFIY